MLHGGVQGVAEAVAPFVEVGVCRLDALRVAQKNLQHTGVGLLCDPCERLPQFRRFFSQESLLTLWSFPMVFLVLQQPARVRCAHMRSSSLGILPVLARLWGLPRSSYLAGLVLQILPQVPGSLQQRHVVGVLVVG